MEHKRYLDRAIELSQSARDRGNMPFGAVLVGPSGEILLEQENVEITEKRCTGHAETILAERASGLYSKEFLWDCTLYTIAEPCAMCSGAIYWGNIGTVVFGITEKKLFELTGSDPKNPTFDLPCHIVFDAGQKDVTLIGPIDGYEEKVAEVQKDFWNK